MFESGELELYSTDDLAIEIIRRFPGTIIITDRNEIKTDPDECSFNIRCSHNLTRKYAGQLLREASSTLKEIFDAQQD